MEKWKRLRAELKVMSVAEELRTRTVVEQLAEVARNSSLQREHQSSDVWLAGFFLLASQSPRRTVNFWQVTFHKHQLP